MTMAREDGAHKFIQSLNESKNSSALSPSVKQLLCEIGVRDRPPRAVVLPSDGAFNRNTSRQRQHVPDSTSQLQDSTSQLQDSTSHCQLQESLVQPTVCCQCRHLLSADGFIRFDHCADLLPTKLSEQPLDDYYRNSVAALADIFACSQDILEDMTSEGFSHIYGQSLLWTKNPELFLECFELLTHNDGADDLLSLLLICTGLEHSLGNLFLLRGKHCPLLLKDLITATELEHTLGADVLQLLQVVIGPPTSMNIRNVSWHGFLSEHELPRRYIFFLLLLTISLGKVLRDKGINHEDVCARDYLPLTSTDDIWSTLGLSDVEIMSLGECLLNSWVVTSGNINFFKAALVYHQHQQYGACVVLLLPLLEHSLRRVFVAANGCPDRLVTAEATSLYTTFEEILDMTLPDGRENMLVQVLGEPCLDLLHDLLMYPSGPRVRDKLGHGEANWHAVPESLAHILLVIFARLARVVHDDLETPATEISCGLSVYSSVFHPISVLHREILNVCKGTANLQADLHLSPSLESWNLEDGYDIFLDNNKMFINIQQALSCWLESLKGRMDTVTIGEWEQMKVRLLMPFSCAYQDINQLLPHKLKTLYRWQKDVYSVNEGVDSVEIPNSDRKSLFNPESFKLSEIVGILSRIIAETETVLTQTRSAVQLRQGQLEQRQLRSRQRDNLTRLLAFFPCASLLANYVAVLSAWHISHLDHFQHLDSRGLKTVLRLLKSSLRTCENMRTFTGKESNKWTQAGQLLVEELQLALKFSTLSIFPS